MWASCLPTEGFSGPQGAVLEQGRAGQPGQVHLWPEKAQTTWQTHGGP